MGWSNRARTARMASVPVRPLLQPVVGDHDVRPAAQLPDLSDGLLGADGGNRLVAPLRQDASRLSSTMASSSITTTNRPWPFWSEPASSETGSRCRLRHGERQFDAEGGAFTRP